MATDIADTDSKTTAPASTAPTAATAAPVTTETKAAPAAATPATPVAKPAAAKSAPAKRMTKRAKPAAKRTLKAVKPAAKPARPIIRAAKAAVTTAAKAATTTAAKAATTVKKEAKIMATKFETPKLFTDVNDRAKAAMDKSGQVVSEMTEFGKGNVEAMVESTRIAASGLQSIGQDAAEYSRKSFETMTATLKSAASVKSPTELFKLHSDYMRSSFDSAIAEMSKSTEAMLKLAGDAAKPLSNRFAVAAEKVKKAA